MIRPITIQAVLNGYVVTVGCQTLAYETRNSMLHDLNNYLENPEKTEGYFMVSALNAKHIMTGPAQAAARDTGTMRDAERLAQNIIQPTMRDPAGAEAGPSNRGGPVDNINRF